MNGLTKLSNGILRFGAYATIALTLACSVSVDSGGETQSRALIDRLPAGATAIAWIDFEALSGALPSERWGAYEEMLQNDERSQALERFQEAVGIDLQDIKQMGIAIMPGTADDGGLILLSADFDNERFESLLTDVSSIEYEGATMYAVDDIARNLETAVGSEDIDRLETETIRFENDAYLLVLDETTLAYGSEESLRIAIDVDGGRRETLKSDPDMNDLISDVAGQGQIWLVATKSTWEERVAGLDQSGAAAMVPTTALESIETMTMSIRMGDGVSVRLSGIAASTEDAAMMTESLNGMISVGKMMLQGSQPELFEILDRGVRAAQDDRTINVEANLTEADIEYLQRMAEDERSNPEIRSGS